MSAAALDSAANAKIATQVDRANAIGSYGVIAYAAPVMGSYFFYIPMWSILPGIYTKYFGLTLSSVAAVLVFIRLFDGVADISVGYLSDRHRAAGGSRKPWVIVGGLGTIVACWFLYIPPTPTTATYYLVCSLAYFLAFAVAEIPHLTWGSELTFDYQRRAVVYGARNISSKCGIAAFYALPLLPMFSSASYTPQVLRVAVFAGAVVTVLALIWSVLSAPAGFAIQSVRNDSPRLLFASIFENRPLLIYIAAVGGGAICYGMWYGLVYIYLDSYLRIGSRVAVIFLVATVASTLTTPLWLHLINRTSKATTWAIGIGIFVIQLLGTLLIAPGDPWWMAFLAVFLANICFTINDVAAVSSMGDIVDYGKLRFRVDRGATYFAILNLVAKVALGIGGGLSLGIAGGFGFSIASETHSDSSVWGLKLGFLVLPACFALVSLGFIVCTPINRRRHRIIQRCVESRSVRQRR